MYRVIYYAHKYQVSQEIFYRTKKGALKNIKERGYEIRNENSINYFAIIEKIKFFKEQP